MAFHLDFFLFYTEVFCAFFHHYSIQIVLFLFLPPGFNRGFNLDIINILAMIDIPPYIINVAVDLLYFLSVVLVDCFFHHVVGLIDAGEGGLHVFYLVQCD